MARRPRLLPRLLMMSTAMAAPDELWLRYPKVADRAQLGGYRVLLGGGVNVTASPLPVAGSAALAQLHSVASELETGLSGLLGQPMPVACCSGVPEAGGSSSSSSSGGSTVGILHVIVVNNSATDAALGTEGFAIGRNSAGE